LLGCFTAAAPAAPSHPDADLAYAERMLRAAGVATDGPGVLNFIRAHTLSEDDLDRLRVRVRALGSSEFFERESASRVLVAAGRPALSFLRPALNDPDLEIARRARRCVEEIQLSPTPHLMTAAAQVVKGRRPPGAAAVLVAYLPCVDEESVEESWFEALRAVGFDGDRPDPALLAALTDRQPIRRAAAGALLGQSASAAVRLRTVPLLADADTRVRYETASSLLRFGEKRAVPVLAGLLTDAPLPTASQAEYLLCTIAEGQGPPVGLSRGDPASRRQCRIAWENWWREHAPHVDLARLKREEPLRGLTLVCEYDGPEGGRVWEFGQDGNPRWEIRHLEGPNDVQALSGGRVLVAERNATRVTERDHSGKILWEHRTTGNPIACQRLSNGNTLVATFNELYEVTADQKKVFTHTHRMSFRHAAHLPNGHVVFVTGHGQVVELDETWKREVRTIHPANFASGATYWASVEPLPNGRYLLALAGANRAIEIDKAGRIQWECRVPRAVFATRLRNGHTLIAAFDDRFVVEVDRDGKEVSKQELRGRPFVVRRH
jgi:hypothetical protein